MFWLQLIILLAFILIGARLKGVGLGIMGALGTILYVYGFGMAPGSPPVDVMLIILSVVTAAASLQAGGGMDFLIGVAEKIIRKRPASITYIAPLVTFFFTVLAGTSHICYSLLPVISEVSVRNRVRPERPLSISVIAAHFGITASPVSAATVAIYDELSRIPGTTIGLMDIVFIVFPASIVGLLAGAFVASRLGKAPHTDPELIAFYENYESGLSTENDSPATKTHTFKARLSVYFFLGGVLLIVLLGMFPQFRTTTMVATIQLVMLGVVALNVIFAGVPSHKIATCSVFKNGAEAVISILGVVWMSNTFINAHESVIKATIGATTHTYPWIFAVALFLAGALLFSQAATVKAIIPLGVKLGILPISLICMYPAVNADFVIPSYPTLVAAMRFDKTGSTRVGRFLLNHSFMLPGLVTTLVTILVAYAWVSNFY